MIRINQVKLPINHSVQELENEIIKQMRIPRDRLISYETLKRSLDARGREAVHYTYSADVLISGEEAYLSKNKNPNICRSASVEYCFAPTGKQKMEKRPVVCGTGPAGLFAAYYLAKEGYCPIVIERGEPVEQREKTVHGFWTGNALNENSNVQFGEGGAGTFSDGKLNTMVKDTSGRIRSVLKTFVQFGAPEEILYINKPHIGTDRLKGVVLEMRKEITRLGGTVLFSAKMTEIITENNKISGIRVVSDNPMPSVFAKEGDSFFLSVDVLVLAIGHSARDTFEMLYKKGISMEAKAFAVGVRVEHEQQMIQKNQYKEFANLLPAADYKLTHTAANGRGIYSFCMCPGGFVVNASSEPGHLVVNGMSNYARNEKNANSAIVVTVNEEDFKNLPGAKKDPLCGMRFQRVFEKLAYETGKGAIPWQLFGDFRAGRESTLPGRIIPNHKGAGRPADLHQCLPKTVADTLVEGMLAFDRKIPGFADEEAVFSGVEMRTSSPVRITRDGAFESNIKGIYPCGEGAGYAGGITSAAVDGIRVYEAIASKYQSR